MATKVTLRQKVISGNRQSLYLDFYPPIIDTETGKPTRREFLGQYIFEKPKNPLDKQHNKETLQLAEQIRQRRENELNKPEIYSAYEREQLKAQKRGETKLLTYFTQLAEKRKAQRALTWKLVVPYITQFLGENVTFNDLTERKCNDFKDYLLNAKRLRSEKSISHNSALTYFNVFKTALRQAYKDELLKTDLNAKLTNLRLKETHRNFLTIEELNTLIKTDCPRLVVKNCALFSALTGLRFSDIQKLVWSEVHHERKNGYSIRFRQKKTGGLELLPISEQAFKLLGERGEECERVFIDLKYRDYESQYLLKWLKLAGIAKSITFHSFRHTYATLQLSAGTDIYTVSKMLGHKDLKSTQIYAKLVDEKKREAANRITLDF